MRVNSVESISAGNMTNNYEDYENNSPSSYDVDFDVMKSVNDSTYLKFKKLSNSEIYCPYKYARESILRREDCLFASGHITITLLIDGDKIDKFEIAFQEKTFGDAVNKKPFNETNLKVSETSYFKPRTLTNLCRFYQRIPIYALNQSAKTKLTEISEVVNYLSEYGMIHDFDELDIIDELTFWDDKDLTRTLSNERLSDIFWHENGFGLAVHNKHDPLLAHKSKLKPLTELPWIHEGYLGHLISDGSLKYNLESAHNWSLELPSVNTNSILLAPLGNLFFTSSYHSNMRTSVVSKTRHGLYRPGGMLKCDDVFGVNIYDNNDYNSATINEKSFLLDAPFLFRSFDGNTKHLCRIALPYFSTSNYSSDNSSSTGILKFSLSETNYEFTEGTGFLDNSIPTKFGPIIGSAGFEYRTYLPTIESFIDQLPLNQFYAQKFIDFFYQILLSGQRKSEIIQRREQYLTIETTKQLLNYAIFNKPQDSHFRTEGIPLNSTDGSKWFNASNFTNIEHKNNPFTDLFPIYKILIRNTSADTENASLNITSESSIFAKYYNTRPTNFKSDETPYTLSFCFNRMNPDYLYKCREINILCDAIESSQLVYGEKVPLLAQCVVKEYGCTFQAGTHISANRLFIPPAPVVAPPQQPPDNNNKPNINRPTTTSKFDHGHPLRQIFNLCTKKDDTPSVVIPPKEPEPVIEPVVTVNNIHTSQTYNAIVIPPPSIILNIDNDEVVPKKLKSGNYSKFHFDLYYPNGEHVYFQRNSATTLTLDLIKYS